MDLPHSHDAIDAASSLLGTPAIEATRMATGLCHRVFSLLLDDGRRVVARMATPTSREDLEGGCYWAPRLGTMGIPVPAILATRHAHRFPCVLLEQLKGADLGDRFAELGVGERLEIAQQLADYQLRVARGIDSSHGRFGYLTLPHHVETLAATWGAVIDRWFIRSRTRLDATQLVDASVLARFERVIASRRDALDAIAPTPFLHDTTTKNVLIHQGAISGIVDTDSICFGDPLITLGLTKSSLAYRGFDGSDYIEPWFDGMGFRAPNRWRLLLYSALATLDFLAEIGHVFNDVDAHSAPPSHISTLASQLLDDLDRAEHE